jgi:hypothetical protein
MPKQLSVRCGGCGKSNILFANLPISTYTPANQFHGLLSLSCQNCGRSIAFWYGDLRWPEHRIYALLRKWFQGKRKRITRKQWPKHLEYYRFEARKVQDGSTLL